jgi:hypothetical protein
MKVGCAGSSSSAAAGWILSWPWQKWRVGGGARWMSGEACKRGATGSHEEKNCGRCSPHTAATPAFSAAAAAQACGNADPLSGEAAVLVLILSAREC